MALQAPTRLGSYQIERLIGAGGMGEVYLAHDTKLGRAVAVKVLPEQFAHDHERVTRFDREAKLLASLNHPNIATLYGKEESAGKHFLIMELVEGGTLAERLKRGPMPVEEALSIARQIAEALEAAHEKGVVHRDLKPANVKITPDDKVKVLDFGLAKAMESAPRDVALSNSPTLSMGSTQAGVILGTAAYMSPEQAKGFQADPRSDVFSFGCVLYEMLTGRQAFQGETISEILAAVLIQEPDFNALPADLNPAIPSLLRRCLDKTPKRRWQATGDLRAEVEAVLARPRLTPAPAAAAPKPRPLWRRIIPLLGFAASIAIAGLVGYNLRRTIQTPIVRFPLVLPDGQRLLTAVSSHVVAISPDGTQLAYLANAQLFLRSMSEMEARPIAGTASSTDSAQAVAEVFFSSDGKWIGFYSRGDATIKKIAVTGGAAVTLCKTDSISGASWEGDQIYFARLRDKGIMRVSENGGEPEEVVARGPGEVLHGPQLINSGRSLLFTLTTEQGDQRWDKAQIVVQPLDSKERKVIIRGGSDARYLPTGHLVYALGGTVFAVPFDDKKVELRGSPVPILEGVMRASANNTAAAHFAFSATGSLVYVAGTEAAVAAQRILALADRSGKAQALPLPPQTYIRPRLSPDGKQVAFWTDDGKDSIVWVYDLKGSGPPRRLTFGGRNFNPIWTPDGRSITFESNREGDFGLFQQRADGSGSAERLTKTVSGNEHVPESWTPDAKTLSYYNSGSGSNVRALMMLSMDGEKKPKPLIEPSTALTQANSAFSPDGHWFAYNSNEPDGRFMHVFVEPFPTTGAKYQLPGEGALQSGAPAWSANGKQIFYALGLQTDQLVAIDVQTTPSFTFGKPTTTRIEGFVGSSGASRNYDVGPDGRFIVVLNAAASQTRTTPTPNPQINVVLNWFEELRERAQPR